MRGMMTGMRGILLVGLAALLSLAACEDKKQAAEADAGKPEAPKAGEGDQCRGNEDCEYGLSCAKDDKTCQKPQTIDCRGRRACKDEGRCYGAQGGGCEARTADDCKETSICKNQGRCTPLEGKCGAATTEDCADICKRMGKCTPQDGKCVAASDDDCKKSDRCQDKDIRECKAEDGRCVK